MEINTFWKIVLKLIGLWLLHDCIYLIPQFFSTLAISQYSIHEDGEAVRISAYLLLTLVVYLLIIWLCLFKTTTLISTLRLDRHFTEQKINLNFSEYKFISAIVILLGGFIFVEGLPALCKEILVFFQQELLITDYARTSWILFYFLSTLFGYLVMTNGRRIASFIQKNTEA